MSISVYPPLVLTVLLAGASRWTASRFPTVRAVNALVAAAALSAAASLWGLVLLAATLLHEVPQVEEIAAARGVHILDPVPPRSRSPPG